MSAIYDNWERLVAAALKKQQLWELFHGQSRSPSILSEASDSDSSFNSSSPLNYLSFGFLSPASSSKSQKVLPNLVLISDFSPTFDVQDVYLDSAKLLGRGIFGSSYKVTMYNGVRIVVKRLKFMIVSEPGFKSQMEIVGSIRHENVAPLRAYYSSGYERLMLYDYYRGGSVFSLLPGKTGQYPAYVNWVTRLRIAIGAARGIAEIHRHNSGTLVHGNIKSSNIFLNQQQYGYVSDVGVSNMFATKFRPAYYSPEVKNNQHVSQESDVYSFGILLFELLYRKSPVDVLDGPKAVDLVKLVGSVKSKDRTPKVFDADLLMRPHIRGQMVKMLQIGVSCVAKSPKKRPKMPDVVKMLEDMMNTGISFSLERELVFVEKGNPTFALKDILTASAAVLGKGTIGTSFTAKFENGKTIVVKRFKNVNVAFREFQHHMEVIGNMRHENVAQLRAHYFSKEVVLLVYDHYDQGSLSVLLHGSRQVGRRVIDWETRLKIAVDAARGIAHIHRQDNYKLVHGNIKSSNIFINEQLHALVSEAGLTKMMNSVERSGMQTVGYYAPEVKDSRKASQASDVYSFGVVLLELVSGRPSKWIDYNDYVILLVKCISSFRRNENTILVFGDKYSTEVFDEVLMRFPEDKEAMVQLLEIAMDCVAIVPESRPKMHEVVRMLEEISGIETESQPSVESRLDELLDDLLPTLAP